MPISALKLWRFYYNLYMFYASAFYFCVCACITEAKFKDFLRRSYTVNSSATTSTSRLKSESL